MTNKFHGLQTRMIYPVLLCMVPIGAGLLSVQFGKSAGFDFLYYHYFNGYAFFTDRSGFDVLPAARGTFLFPLLDAFQYALIENLPARAVGFILGAIHGLNFLLVGAIAVCVLPSPRNLLESFFPLLLAAGGFLGSVSLGILGSFHHDNVVSIFFLSALLVMCRISMQPMRGSAMQFMLLALAGFIAGLGLGLKLTLAPFAVGIGLAPLFMSWPVSKRFLGIMAIGAAGFVGTVGVMGYHMTQLFIEFGNPLFPFFPFLSAPPYDGFMDPKDPRYLPSGILETLLYPLYFAFDPNRVSEFVYRDFRLPVTFAVAVLFGAAVGMRSTMLFRAGTTSSEKAAPELNPAAIILLGVVAVSYAGWLGLLSLYRYALPLELLSFVVLALMLFQIFGWRLGGTVLVFLGLVIVATTERIGVGRRAWGDGGFVETRLPSMPVVRQDAIVLIAGANAGTYYIPAFPSSVRFLGVDVIDIWEPHVGERRGPPAPESVLGPFPGFMRQIVSTHSGQILGVFQDNDRVRAVRAYSNYRLGFDPRDCGRIRSNIESRSPLYLCELQRMAGK